MILPYLKTHAWMSLVNVCLVSVSGHELNLILHLVRQAASPGIFQYHSVLKKYSALLSCLFFDVVIPPTLDAVDHSGQDSFMSA